jgi:Spy/CpxP family protein refolding chaperone
MFAPLKTVLFGSVCLAIAALPAAASAEPPHGEGMGEIGPMKVLLRTANLTSDQQAQVRQLMQTNREQVQPLRSQIHTLRQQIAAKLFNTGTVTMADLTPMEQQIAQLHAQIADASLKAALKIRALLSNDQLTRMAQTNQKLESLHAQMESLMNPDGTASGPGVGLDFGP